MCISSKYGTLAVSESIYYFLCDKYMYLFIRVVCPPADRPTCCPSGYGECPDYGYCHIFVFFLYCIMSLMVFKGSGYVRHSIVFYTCQGESHCSYRFSYGDIYRQSSRVIGNHCLTLFQTNGSETISYLKDQSLYTWGNVRTVMCYNQSGLQDCYADE